MMSEHGGCCYCKLCPLSFGLAGGITTGLLLFLISIVAMFFGLWQEAITTTAQIYPGYDATWMGAFKGLLWGFVEGFIFFAFLAWIYDCILCCFARKSCGCPSGKPCPHSEKGEGPSNKGTTCG